MQPLSSANGRNWNKKSKAEVWLSQSEQEHPSYECRQGIFPLQSALCQKNFKPTVFFVLTGSGMEWGQNGALASQSRFLHQHWMEKRPNQHAHTRLQIYELHTPTICTPLCQQTARTVNNNKDPKRNSARAWPTLQTVERSRYPA